MINRMQPRVPPQMMQTYSVAAPLRTHWRPATCAEVECGSYLRGWRTIVPAQGVHADYIRSQSGRRYTVELGPDGLATFTFEAGQRCFHAHDHRVPLGRPPVYLVRAGDWRQSTPLRNHSGADPWVDDLRSHTERVARERE